MGKRRKRYIVHHRFETVITYEVMAFNVDHAARELLNDQPNASVTLIDTVRSENKISARRKEPGE